MKAFLLVSVLSSFGLLATPQLAHAGGKMPTEDWLSPWHPVSDDEDYTCIAAASSGKPCRVCVPYGDGTADQAAAEDNLTKVAKSWQDAYASGQELKLGDFSYVSMKARPMGDATYDHKVCRTVSFGHTEIPSETWIGPHQPLSNDENWDCVGAVMKGKECNLCVLYRSDEDNAVADRKVQDIVNAWKQDYSLKGNVSVHSASYSQVRRIKVAGERYSKRSCQAVSVGPGAVEGAGAAEGSGPEGSTTPAN